MATDYFQLSGRSGFKYLVTVTGLTASDLSFHLLRKIAAEGLGCLEYKIKVVCTSLGVPRKEWLLTSLLQGGRVTQTRLLLYFLHKALSAGWGNGTWFCCI